MPSCPALIELPTWLRAVLRDASVPLTARWKFQAFLHRRLGVHQYSQNIHQSQESIGASMIKHEGSEAVPGTKHFVGMKDGTTTAGGVARSAHTAPIAAASEPGLLTPRSFKRACRKARSRAVTRTPL